MGNALVDILTPVSDDSILNKFGFQKGSMTLVDLELSHLLQVETTGFKKSMASGGSAANTIHGTAHLGIPSGYIGKIGNDDVGKFFQKDMEQHGIHSVLYHSMLDTGRVMAFISTDSERTMATYLGAASEISDADITSDIFQGYTHFYIEGYLINNKRLISKALRLARTSGLKTCIDLASFNIVEQHKKNLCKALSKSIDIIFANEDEARAISGQDPQGALDFLSQLCDIAVVKLGERGSLVKRGNESHEVPSFIVNSIDTTGAGDLFASGFLYGLSKDLPLDKCARIGNYIASEVVQIIGPKLSEKTWEEIRVRVLELEKE